MEIPSIPIERAPPAMTLPSEQGPFLAKGSEPLTQQYTQKESMDGQLHHWVFLASPSPALSQDSPIWT